MAAAGGSSKPFYRHIYIKPELVDSSVGAPVLICGSLWTAGWFGFKINGASLPAEIRRVCSIREKIVVIRGDGTPVPYTASENYTDRKQNIYVVPKTEYNEVEAAIRRETKDLEKPNKDGGKYFLRRLYIDPSLDPSPSTKTSVAWSCGSAWKVGWFDFVRAGVVFTEEMRRIKSSFNIQQDIKVFIGDVGPSPDLLNTILIDHDVKIHIVPANTEPEVPMDVTRVKVEPGSGGSENRKDGPSGPKRARPRSHLWPGPEGH